MTRKQLKEKIRDLELQLALLETRLCRQEQAYTNLFNEYRSLVEKTPNYYVIHNN